MTTEALKQIVYALERQERALQAQADRLSDQLDYSAEFLAEDAQRMREAIRILSEPRVLGAGLDPWPNSGDPAIADALRAPDDDSFIKGLRIDAVGNVGIGEPDVFRTPDDALFVKTVYRSQLIADLKLLRHWNPTQHNRERIIDAAISALSQP